MNRIAALLLWSWLAGCGAGESAVLLTIDSASAISGIDHFDVLVTHQGRAALPATISIAGRPVDLPPIQTVQLRFDKSREGAARIHVDAVDAAGRVLAGAETTVELSPSHDVPATVRFDGPSGGDGGVMDQRLGPDLALPAPLLTSVTPDHGPTSGNTVTLKGTHFQIGATARFGGQLALSISVNSSSELTAVTPALTGKSGVVDVQVTNPDGQSALLPRGYIYDRTVTFAAPVGQPSGGMAPYAAALADLDKDTKPDLVVCLPFDASVSILRGKGDGGFALPIVLAEGQKSLAVALGDFNGDGWTDAATAQTNVDQIGIRLNDGKGGLTPPSSVALLAGSGPISMAIADFDGDGKSDLASANRKSATVAVLRGKGDGTFEPARYWPLSGAFPTQILAGHFDAGKTFDLAVGDVRATSVSLLPGAGDGSFGAEKRADVGVPAYFLASGDFDGNDVDDLVTTGLDRSGVFVLFGGPAGFARPVNHPTDSTAAAIAIADLNLDGRADFVVTDAGAGSIGIYVAAGDGTFGQALRVPTVPGTQWVGVADVNGDGLGDLLSIAPGSPNLQISLNTSR